MAVSFVSQPPKLVLAGNPVNFRVLADNYLQAPGIKNIFHRVGATISINSKEIENDFQCKTPDDMPESLIGQADIRMSNLLQKYKTGHFTFPETGEQFFFKKDILDIINISVRESWGIPLQQSEIVNSNDIYVLQGKLNNTKLGELNDLGSNFYSKLTSSGQFLTDQPVEKQTDIYAPERLFWFADKAFTATLKIGFTFVDGTTETKTTDPAPLTANSIYEVITSYKSIRLGTTKKVASYTVQIFSGAVAVSPKQTYNIDYNYYSYARYFLSRNKYGVYDLFRTTGKASKKRKIAKQAITLNLPDNFKSTDREIRQVSSKSSIPYILNSGFLRDSLETEWISELLESTDAYWLKKGKAYPVSILDSDNPIYQDGEPNNYLEFEVQHAIIDDIPEVFSALEPIEVAGDFNYDYNTDYFTGGAPPEPEQDPNTEVFFQSDFSTWLPDSDPLFPMQPIGLNINSGVDNVSIVNDNDRLSLTINDMNDWIQIFFKKPSDILYSGKYLFTIQIDQLACNPELKISPNYRYDLIEGLNSIEINLNTAAFAFFELFQPGTCIISNIKIEKIL